MRRLYLSFAALLVLALLLSISMGSTDIPLKEVGRVLMQGSSYKTVTAAQPYRAILWEVRLPRTLAVAAVGAALSISGAAMQGLLRNPLADGTTLGVSAGASLGAVLAIAFDIRIPGLPGAAVTIFSMGFAFLALLIILGLAHKIDFSMSTNTVILVGVVFSMFAGSITSLLVTVAGSKVRSIIFWTMGSFVGSNYNQALLMGTALVFAGGLLLSKAEELNAFAIGEDNAAYIGVPIKRIKLQVMILVAILIGIAVSISGTIGFVGLIIPHMTRILTGPNHQRLLPLSMLFGAVFLLLADLVSRMLFRPIELPIGVITSFAGSLVFVYIFYRARQQL